MNVFKNWMIFLSIFVLCFGFTACSAEENKSSNDVKSQTDDLQVTSNGAGIESVDSDAVITPTYTFDIEGKNWNVDGITVKYPMLINYDMQEKSDELNDLIMTDMSDLIETIKGNVDDKTLIIDGTFEYSQIAPTVLSISYSIAYSADSLAYPANFYHTITISLDQVAIIPLSDLFVINDAFVEDFKTWVYAPYREDLNLEASGYSIDELISQQYSNEELIKLLSQTNATYYLTDQGLIVSIEVPHALGDHLEMAMKYEFLEGYMVRDHFLWENYMFLSEAATDDQLTLFLDTTGLEERIPNYEYVEDSMVSYSIDELPSTDCTEDAVLERIKGMSESDITLENITEAEEYSKLLSCPSWLVAYTIGENEDTKECVDIYVQTENGDYRVHVVVPSDFFTDYHDVIFSRLSTLQWVNK